LPQPTIPTKEELSRLPRRAVVAFAARCARRVQPIFAAWSGATQEHIAAVDRAISLAEAYAYATADAAHAAFAAFAVDAREPFICAMRRDLELLAQAAATHYWNDDSAVPPDFLGPLWPNGEPPAPPAGPRRWSMPLWTFLGHVLGGCAVFMLIAIPAVLLNLLVTRLAGLQISPTLLIMIEVAEYTLVGVDVGLFVVFILKTAWRTIRDL